MNLQIAGHHIEVTPALRLYVENKLEPVIRHFDKVAGVNVILSVEKLKLALRVFGPVMANSDGETEGPGTISCLPPHEHFVQGQAAADERFYAIIDSKSERPLGVAAYLREVAACTEQYWCPIKYARRIKGAHERYPRFFDYGDAEAFRQGLNRLRRQYDE